MDATIYFDISSNPQNPGWICETEEGQFQLDADSLDASDDELLAEGRAFADGEITIRR